MRKYLKPLAIGLAGTTIGLTGGSAALAQDCDYFQIAAMNWASGELMAHVDALILEHGYGCDIEVVPGATQTTFASMNEKGQPDIVPEFWISTFREPLFAAFEAGKLHSVLDGPITGMGEGWWITSAFAAQYPELDTVEKILERPDLFPDFEDPSKGALTICLTRWACNLSNVNMFRAFDMEAKGWKMVDPGSAAGLDGSIVKAVERGENWFGFYWSPTALVGKYGLIKVPFEAEWAGAENWDGCISKPAEECAEPQKTSWTETEVHTVVTDHFKQTAGQAVGYLEKRTFPGDVMNEMLVYMQDEDADGQEAAMYFLETHKELWQSWVPAGVAKRVDDALFW